MASAPTSAKDLLDSFRRYSEPELQGTFTVVPTSSSPEGGSIKPAMLERFYVD